MHDGLVIRCLLVAVGIFAGDAVAGQFLAIQHVDVVDVEGKDLKKDQVVRIRDDRIFEVVDSTEFTPGADDRIVDATGLYAYPGLIDSHIHLNDPDRESLMMVANGVLFARDMGGQTKKRLNLREIASRGALHGLRLSVTGNILDGRPPYHAWATACDSPEEGRQAVRALHQNGVDQVKVYTRLKPDVYRAILEEASSLGLPVVGHIPDSITAQEAMAAGQRSVEHLSRLETLLASKSPQAVAAGGSNGLFAEGHWLAYPRIALEDRRAIFGELRRANMAQCPTLVLLLGQARVAPDKWTQNAWKDYAEGSGSPWWESEIPAQWAAYGQSLRDSLPSIYEAVREMHEAEVPLLIGTDLANLGILAGFSVHQEMRLWQKAGIPAADVLRYATIVPANFLGIEDAYGTIAAGRTANFVLSRANPLEDISHAAEIDSVVIAGTLYRRPELDKLLEMAQQLTRSRQPLDLTGISPSMTGEEVQHGRYDYKYLQWASGNERFQTRSTEHATEFESIVDLAGWGTPVRVLGRIGAAGDVERLQYETLTQLSTGFTLEHRSGDTWIRSRFDDQTTAERSISIQPGDLMMFCWTVVGLQLGRCRLEVANTMPIQVLSWDNSLRTIEAVPCELTRRPDESLPWNQAMPLCRVFRWNTLAPADPVEFTAWVSEDGRLLQASRAEGAETRHTTLVP